MNCASRMNSRALSCIGGRVVSCRYGSSGQSIGGAVVEGGEGVRKIGRTHCMAYGKEGECHARCC